MTTRAYGFSALCLLLFFSSAGADVIERTFDVSSSGRLAVSTDFGSIDVTRADDSRVHVKVTRRGSSGEDLDIDFRADGSSVSVRGDYRGPKWHGNMSAQFEIRVPAGFDVDLRTSGGSIGVDGIDGEVEVDTSGGSIDLGHLRGPVNGRTSGGSIRLRNGMNSVKLETSGGSIRIGDVDGSLEVSTSGGSIDIGRVTGRVRASTSGGSIDIEEAGGGMEARTSGGSIDARVPQTPSGDSRLRTSGGRITLFVAEGVGLTVDADGNGVDSAFPVGGRSSDDDELQGAMNGGGPDMVLRASGRIRIRKL